jgi:hypothetical protein
MVIDGKLLYHWLVWELIVPSDGMIVADRDFTI